MVANLLALLHAWNLSRGHDDFSTADRPWNFEIRIFRNHPVIQSHLENIFNNSAHLIKRLGSEELRAAGKEGRELRGFDVGNWNRENLLFPRGLKIHFEATAGPIHFFNRALCFPRPQSLERLQPVTKGLFPSPGLWPSPIPLATL